MTTINYSIQFYSEWHAGSGLTSGSDLSALVIKDKDGLSYIPGRTLKGLLREAAEDLKEFGKCDQKFIEDVFGLPPTKTEMGEDAEAKKSNKVSTKGNCFFSNATLSPDMKLIAKENQLSKFFYRSVASTSIEESGVARKGSLRTMETTIPCTLYAEITGFPNDPKLKEQIEYCFQWVKRLGQNRHRGLGRCQFQRIEEKEDAK